jgi:hypothetical protein
MRHTEKELGQTLATVVESMLRCQPQFRCALYTYALERPLYNNRNSSYIYRLSGNSAVGIRSGQTLYKRALFLYVLINKVQQPKDL